MYDACGVAEWQAAQQHAAHGAEHSDRRAESEHECEQRGDGEDRVASQAAPGKREIGNDGIEDVTHADLASALLVDGERVLPVVVPIAELGERGGARGVR